MATAVAGAGSSIATGPGPVQYVACAASVLGLGLQAVACRADRPAAVAPSVLVDPAGSALGALLPHCTALVGGALLLLSVPLTGRLTIFGTTLGVLGLVSLLAHQTVTWRTQQRLTQDLQRSQAWFRTLVRSSVDPVVILDDQLTVTFASPAIADLLGVEPQRIVGRADRRHRPPRRRRRPLRRAAAPRSDDEVRRPHRPGPPVPTAAGG